MAALLLRWIALRCVVIALGAAASSVIAAAPDPERAELAAARQRIEADHARREVQCRQQFVVTSCVEAAEATRREGLAALQARQAEIDDRERKARAAARLSRIEAKQQRRKDTPSPLPLVPADSAAAQEAAAEQAVRAAGRTPHAPTGKPAGPAARQAKPKVVDEQQEAARFDARQAEARSRKAAAAQRQKEQERAGKPPRAPLPPVGGASQAKP